MQLSDRIESNLTGGHVQHILDDLMLGSIRPVILNSDVFDLQLTSLMATAMCNRKRKVSALQREEFINRMSQALVSKDRTAKFEIVKTAKIERGFIYNFVVNFLRETANYEEIYFTYLSSTGVKKDLAEKKLEAIESSVGCSRKTLFSTLREAQAYLELMYEFRNGVVEQYNKLASKMAAAYISDKPNFSYRDVHQNFMAAITKAVDKYDSSLGALTSYVKFWVRNAQSYTNPEHGHEYGIAYTIPQQQRERIAQGRSGEINYSVSLDQLSGEDGDTTLLDLLTAEENDHEDIEAELVIVRTLAKQADPGGLARLYLDIEEVLSETELAQQQAEMRGSNEVETEAAGRNGTTVVRVVSGDGNKDDRRRSGSLSGVLPNCKEGTDGSARKGVLHVHPVRSSNLRKLLNVRSDQ